MSLTGSKSCHEPADRQMRRRWSIKDTWLNDILRLSETLWLTALRNISAEDHRGWSNRSYICHFGQNPPHDQNRWPKLAKNSSGRNKGGQKLLPSSNPVVTSGTKAVVAGACNEVVSRIGAPVVVSLKSTKSSKISKSSPTKGFKASHNKLGPI